MTGSIRCLEGIIRISFNCGRRLVLMGVCVSFFAGEKQDQIGNVFSFLIPLRKFRLWEVWKDGYLLMAFLRS